MATGNDCELGFSGAKGLERGLVAEHIFARLQARVGAVLGAIRQQIFLIFYFPCFSRHIEDTHPPIAVLPEADSLEIRSGAGGSALVIESSVVW